MMKWIFGFFCNWLFPLVILLGSAVCKYIQILNVKTTQCNNLLKWVMSKVTKIIPDSP